MKNSNYLMITVYIILRFKFRGLNISASTAISNTESFKTLNYKLVINLISDFAMDLGFKMVDTEETKQKWNPKIARMTEIPSFSEKKFKHWERKGAQMIELRRLNITIWIMKIMKIFIAHKDVWKKKQTEILWPTNGYFVTSFNS